MEGEKLDWKGYEVQAAHATWVCTRSRSRAVGFTSPATFKVDGIDFFLEFVAKNKKSPEVPDSRTLQLRTSEHLTAADRPFLALVVDGQMLESSPWDRFIEVYKRD